MPSAKNYKKSPQVTRVYCVPGNAGMAQDGIKCIAIAETDSQELIAFAKKQRLDWVFVGPEVPLLAGVVDDLQAANIQVFGPQKKAAIIEGSKDFAKQLMQSYHIPTAASQTFTVYDEAKTYIEMKGAPIVIKADGLAAGKGVVVAETTTEALEAAYAMLCDNQFGASGAAIVVEDFLVGEEFSLMAFVDGENVYPMVIAQDHKRALAGDKGLNTGGMGAYAPVHHISQAVINEAVETILKPTAVAMVTEERSFTGILYAGLILTASGPKVIEFNARFGDPETQVVLDRLTSDFATVITDILAHRTPTLTWQTDGVTLGVVLASKGYPQAYENGKLLAGFEQLNHDTAVFHAGVALNATNELVTNGGRVSLLAMRAKTMQAAQAMLYQELKKIDTRELVYREDIGHRAATAERPTSPR
ncbi:phosphoribosylamine--glycine ligase [Brochothrix campestris FSL F6-1037]|uniref:Phosphoribosylamine--glycine ligase n=1 Tax=Brochothrix campestris FSL F6-1037 TaxID=1265861 RepID=W7CM11_9LIST|nr:phosphoribosylamine--glycine ligase [Brochothrix campestris FSL F6-1037]